MSAASRKESNLLIKAAKERKQHLEENSRITKMHETAIKLASIKAKKLKLKLLALASKLTKPVNPEILLSV